MGKSKLIIFISLLGITIWGGVLRMMFLSKSPPSVNWDEAAMGYNAYSLLETGRDEYGYELPLVFRSFDDYKPPMYPYLTVVPVWLLGLGEVAVRITAAIFGTLNLVLVMLMVRRMRLSWEVALLAGLVMATAPVLVNFSRLAFEANPALTMFLIGLNLSLGINISRARFFWALVFVGLASFGYNSQKVYLGLFGLWQLRRILRDVRLFVSAGAIAVLSMLGGALGRFNSTSIFSVWNGSVIDFVGQVVNRYWSYFSLSSLFVNGSNEPSQHVLGFGIFFIFLAPFFVWGIVELIRLKNNSDLKYWFFVAPIPAILTWNWFSPIRVLPFWVFVSIVMALGLRKIWKTKIIKLFVVGAFGFYTVALVIALRFRLPYLEYGNWQWGFRETIQVISGKLDGYQKIVWETPQAQPHIFVLFYSKYDPKKYHQDIAWLKDDKSPRKNFDFGPYEFRKTYWPADRDLKGILFVGTTEGLKETDIERDERLYDDIFDPAGYVVQRIVY